MATLALARHDFRDGLRLARRARRLGPELARPFSVLVDAEVELGRYEQAGRSLQRMIDLQPTLASYARVSYFRELHGDLAGAASAMSLAVSAGAGAPENVAYVQTLLGDLEALRGRPGAARRAYAAALAGVEGYVPAIASLAQLDAATGHLPAAIRGYEAIVRRRPLPQYVIALGEIQQVAGRRAEARETFALVDAERRLLAAGGVNTDVEIALFEADHGDRGRAVDLARRAWRDAPSVRSADAVELGADAIRARERWPGLGASSAAAGFARSAHAHASGPDRPRGRARCRGPPVPAQGAAGHPALLGGLGSPSTQGAARAHMKRLVALFVLAIAACVAGRRQRRRASAGQLHHQSPHAGRRHR